MKEIDETILVILILALVVLCGCMVRKCCCNGKKKPYRPSVLMDDHQNDVTEPITYSQSLTTGTLGLRRPVSRDVNSRDDEDAHIELLPSVNDRQQTKTNVNGYQALASKEKMTNEYRTNSMITMRNLPKNEEWSKQNLQRKRMEDELLLFESQSNH